VQAWRNSCDGLATSLDAIIMHCGRFSGGSRGNPPPNGGSDDGHEKTGHTLQGGRPGENPPLRAARTNR
jgi:hypothetical protein